MGSDITIKDNALLLWLSIEDVWTIVTAIQLILNTSCVTNIYFIFYSIDLLCSISFSASAEDRE